MRPTRGLGSAPLPPADRGCALLFGLAPGRVCRVSLRSPGGSASSLWHWSSPRGGRALPAALRWGARTFLTPTGRPGDARPSGRLAGPPSLREHGERGPSPRMHPAPAVPPAVLFPPFSHRTGVRPLRGARRRATRARGLRRFLPGSHQTGPAPETGVTCSRALTKRRKSARGGRPGEVAPRAGVSRRPAAAPGPPASARPPPPGRAPRWRACRRSRSGRAARAWPTSAGSRPGAPSPRRGAARAWRP